MEDGKGCGQVGCRIIEAPRKAMGVPAVTHANGLATTILQFTEVAQALRQRADRGAGVAVIACHDGELPHGAGLPALVAEPADHLKAHGYQRECLPEPIGGILAQTGLSLEPQPP